MQRLPHATSSTIRIMRFDRRLLRLGPLLLLGLIAGVETAAAGPSPAPPVSPDAPDAVVIVARKAAELLEDVNGDGQADVGDTLRYGIEIRNTGDMDAVDMVFEDTIDPNTTLLPGRIMTSPRAASTASGGSGASRPVRWPRQGPDGLHSGETVMLELGTLVPSQAFLFAFEVTIDEAAAGGEVCNQGTIEWQEPAALAPAQSSHGAASLQQNALTDDPGTEEPDDPTCTPVGERDEPTAARLLDLHAIVDRFGTVRVSWTTGSEHDLLGFHLYRRAKSGADTRVTERLLPARGSGVVSEAYAFRESLAPGTYTYRLEAVSDAGAPQVLGSTALVVETFGVALPAVIRR